MTNYDSNTISIGMTVTRSGRKKVYSPDWITKQYKRQTIKKNNYSVMMENYFLGDKNGTIYHSTVSPAIVTFYTFNGEPCTTTVTYYVQGFHIKKTCEFCELSGMDDMETVAWVLKYGDDLPNVIDGDPYDLKRYFK